MKNFKRLISGISSLAILITSTGLVPVGVKAAEEEITTVYASSSGQIKYTGSEYTVGTTGATMEIRSDDGDNGTKAYMGGLSFDLSPIIDETEAGKEIESVNLVTYSERSKSSNKTLNVKLMGNDWETDDTVIDAAYESDAVAEMTLVAQNNAAMFDNITEFDVAKWVNEVDITECVADALEDGKLNLLLENARVDSKNQQILFTGSMSTAVYNNSARSETMASRLGLTKAEDEEDYDWSIVYPRLEVSYKTDEEPTPEVTDEPTPTPTAEPTENPTETPAAEQLPEGAIVVKDQVSNVATTQTITVDEYGNTRAVAYTTNNTSIWYLGNYDLSKLDKITMRLGLVAGGDTLPQVKLAYMPLDGSEIDADYINTNSGAIRSSNNMVALIEGKTEPAANAADGHKYLGALYEITPESVAISADDTYSTYPGGTASLGANLTPLNTTKADGEVALFVYATAQSRRAAIDYVLIEEKSADEMPTPTPTPLPDETTPEPDEPTHTPAPADDSIPEGAVVVKDRTNTGGSTTSLTVNVNGDKRDAAYTTNNNTVWYLGDYDMTAVDSIEMRLGLVGSSDGTNKPLVKLAYMPLDGSEINTDYISANSGTIRSNANMIATVEGLTQPSANAADGHKYLGAVYTVTEAGVTVDSEGYAAYPGGTATVGDSSTGFIVPKNSDGESMGKVALFVYATAQSRRAVIDYIKINEKVLVPTSLEISGDDIWVIRDNVAADYETNADDYKALLISDLGTEMKYDDTYVTWTVSGSDYITTKSPSGSNSAMIAETDLPIGTHTITLTADYEGPDGVRLSATKTITVEKRESSVPASITISGEKKIELLNSELPAEAMYTVTVLDQFGVEMEDVVIDWSVSGEITDGYSINDGVLSIGNTAKSSVIRVKAASRMKPEVSAELDVEITLSEYPSTLYPTADVLFRMNNSDAKNVNGDDIEIRNAENSDRGFSGGLKFDISTLKAALAAGYPINSISVRLTTSLSKDGKLMLKEFSNDWDESSSTINSFENKSDIINEAIASEVIVVNNDAEGVFTLNRQAKDKRIHEGELGDSETISNWQTTLDITDYIKNWTEENPDSNEISFLLMANYNGTASNTIFSKDVDSEYANWAALTTKFPELINEPELLYPAIVVDYAQETVTVSSNVNALPIPNIGLINSTSFSAVHYNPFTDTSDENIVWSISGFKDVNGNATEAEGISIDENGVLRVNENAKPGTVTIRASVEANKVIYAEMNIQIIRLVSQLANGSFEIVDDAMMPTGWISYDPAIDDAHNGIQRYQMDQSSETALSNFLRNNDNDGYLSGTHNAEDPTGIYGKKTVKISGAHGIDKDYEGRVYFSNAANSGNDGGPDLRVTSGVTYWVRQDYHLENFYQLNTSSMVGPYVGYEGFQGGTGKSSQLGGNWYIKDGSAATAYTTDGYDTLTQQVTIPQNIDRLRINWGLTGSEGDIYFHNFRLAPQGIDTSKAAVDGVNELKVTGEMTWTSEGVAVTPGEKYTYKMYAVSEATASAVAEIMFMDSDGNVIKTKNIEIGQTNAWTEAGGEIEAPVNSAYASVKLANSTGNGSVWYDNIIFTKTAPSEATYARITSGNDMVIAPLTGETSNTYQYTASITDQYYNAYNGDVVWSLDDEYTGVSIRSNGVLVVSDTAESCTVTVRVASAENSDVYAEKSVKVVKKTIGEDVTLGNGDFTDYDENLLIPNGWSNSERTVSIANGSFDSSISGWKLNYTSYTNADTSAIMEWDSTIDHTGNSGGSARIYNADRAQGSMQISQNAEIQGGNTYEISVWVKTDNVSADSNVYTTLIFYNETGSTIEENKNLLVLNPAANSNKDENGWTKLSGTIYANELAVKLRIDMRYRGGANNQNGTVWFDDLEIRKLTGLDPSVTYNDTPALLITGYGEEETDVSRTYGEKWDSDPITNITPGQQYNYSAAATTFNADEGGYIMVTYYDEYGRTLSSETSEKIKGTNSSWKTVSGTSTAPENASYAIVSLAIDGRGRVWFADVEFETKTGITVADVEISGADTVAAPGSAQYKVVVTDANGTKIDTLDIPMSAECPAGVTFDSTTGILTVTDNANGGDVIKLTASYNGITVTKTVSVLENVTSISISGNSSVTISSSSAKTVSYSILNQSGQKIAAEDAQWSVTGNNVTIKDGVLTVEKNAGVQTITIKAVYNGLKAEKKVNLANSSSSGGSGGGGGGGGGSMSGIVNNTTTVNGSSGTASGVNGTAMGNFGTGLITPGVTGSTTETVNGEAIIPQPDPTYFTQGMDNIGGFTDIGSVTWAQKAIVAMSAVNIISGKEEGKFYPDDNVTRAEFVKMLIGTLEYAGRIDTSDKTCSFADVAEDAWYYDAVAIAVNNGIVQGISDTEFAPNANITRQDMAVMMYRAAKVANISLASGAELIFTDADAISDYAREAVTAMSKANIINGFEDGTFSPKTNATRAQAAVVIYRTVGGTD